MNTVPVSDLVTECVAERPLETVDQLQPGVIISGNAAQHAWQVLHLDELNPDWILLKHLMKGVRQHSHSWQPQGEGAAQCEACGLRRQRIADLLPVTAPRVRVVIPPTGVRNALHTHTLYATTSGTVVTVDGPGSARTWSIPLAILPMLRPVWQVPCALLALMRASPSSLSGILVADAEREEDVL